MEKKTANYWIEKLQMQAHPEGGYYKETYRSDEAIPQTALPDRYHGSRNFGTAIYFLINKARPSKFHRIKSDEIWFFHAGDPVRVYVFQENGEFWKKDLGSDPEMNQSFQVLIPRNSWFAADVISPGDYSLVSCTVSPGFHFDDFEMAQAEELKALFPEKSVLIERLT